MMKKLYDFRFIRRSTLLDTIFISNSESLIHQMRIALKDDRCLPDVKIYLLLTHFFCYAYDCRR
jgi:hypothetical protein